MNTRWYYQNRFPNHDYLKYLRRLINDSETIAELKCAAQAMNVYRYDYIGTKPTYAVLKFMKKHSADGNNDEYFMWLSTNCFNHSIHYSFTNNEIEIFTGCFFDTEMSTIWLGRTNHQLQLFGRYERTLKPFLAKVFSHLTDGEMYRPLPPKEGDPNTLCIKPRSWKRFARRTLDPFLETLIIRCPAVTTFTQHIMNLENLSVLDLSNNNIVYIPQEFGNLQIKELYLANNRIGSANNWKWLISNKLCGSLQVLDLSNNRITNCPDMIGRLNLNALNLNDNFIERVPYSIGRMMGLRCLRLARNHLRAVPESLFRIPIKYLDLTSNNLESIRNIHAIPPPGLDQSRPKVYNAFSLSQIACNVMTRNHIYGGEGTPNAVEELLDGFKRCFCGNPGNANFCHICRVSSRRLFPVVVYKNSRMFGVSVVFYCCSPQCYNIMPK